MSTTVPRMDLAPKLQRPLQPWNPLDYLRLLYWVFFFPQALRWYVGPLPTRSIVRPKGATCCPPCGMTLCSETLPCKGFS